MARKGFAVRIPYLRTPALPIAVIDPKGRTSNYETSVNDRFFDLQKFCLELGLTRLTAHQNSAKTCPSSILRKFDE